MMSFSMDATLLTQLRSYRLAGIALFDVVVATLSTYFSLRYFNFNTSLLEAFTLSILVGIVVHAVLDVPTALNKALGISE